MEIAEFILARIAEDEDTARAAVFVPNSAGASWRGYAREVIGQGGRQVADTTSGWYSDHIVRWDPSRVLAECKARRAVVKLHAECDREGYTNAAAYMANALQALAAVYKDHPDYSEEWVW